MPVFCAKGIRGEISTIAFSATSQLRSLVVFFSLHIVLKMELRGKRCCKSILKIETVRTKHLFGTALIFGGGDPVDGRRLLEPLYGLAVACREWYGTLKSRVTGFG